MKKIFASESDKIHVIPLKKIIYLKGENNYTRIVLKNKTIVVSLTLKKYETLLGNDFLRVSKSFIVNINKIDFFGKKDRYLKMVDESEILIPSRRLSYIYNTLKN